MFGKNRMEVLVVGAGPVGMFAALLLAKRGIQVVIVDQDWRTGAHSYALALHPRSLQLLEELGLQKNILDNAFHIRTIGIYDDSSRRAEMRIPAEEGLALPLAVLRQDIFEDVLEQTLRQAHVKVLWNHRVARLVQHKDHVVATIDRRVKESVGYAIGRTEWVIAKTYDIKAPYVIGADGHQSSVRRALGIDFPDLGGTRHFAVFEFESDTDLDHEMRIILGPTTTNVLWPLRNGLCRWSFELSDNIPPKVTRTKKRIPVAIGSTYFPVLEKDYLRTLTAERAPWFRHSIDRIHWRIVVRFERRLAACFGKGRIWLAGDAGHLTGPVGMQSMNVGLREANQLANQITAILRDGESIDRLQEYNQDRIAEWQCLLGLQGSLVPEDPNDPWSRDCSERLLPCIPGSDSELADLAKQIRLRYSQWGYQ